MVSLSYAIYWLKIQFRIIFQFKEFQETTQWHDKHTVNPQIQEGSEKRKKSDLDPVFVWMAKWLAH